MQSLRVFNICLFLKHFCLTIQARSALRKFTRRSGELINQALLAEAITTLPHDLITGEWERRVWRSGRRVTRNCSGGFMHNLLVKKGLCIKPSDEDGCVNIILCLATNYGIYEATIRRIIRINDNSKKSCRYPRVIKYLTHIMNAARIQEEKQAKAAEYNPVATALEIIGETGFFKEEKVAVPV